MLGGLLGGSGVSSIAGALSQFSGAPPAAAQAAIGAVAQAAIGTIGQQDPSNWSDPSSIAALFGSQKDAIAAALPPELAKALGATGLLAGLGGLGAAAAQRGDHRSLQRRERRAPQRPPRGSAAASRVAAAAPPLDQQRISDVGDHRARRGRAGGHVVVHDPEPERPNRPRQGLLPAAIELCAGAAPGSLRRLS